MINIFERFTERARQVTILAQDEARVCKASSIGTDHILLGLLLEEEGLAARLLDSLDVTVEEVRIKVERWDRDISTGQIPFTPRAKKVLELALREALSLGHNYIGTEHILLGLVRDDADSPAMEILNDLIVGDTPHVIRKEVIRMLSGPGRRPPAGDVVTTSGTSGTIVNQSAKVAEPDVVRAARIIAKSIDGLAAAIRYKK